MPERFEDALKALRHVARGNGLVMKIAARLESAHKREVDMAGAASAVDVSDDGPSGHEGAGDYSPITIELRMLAEMSKYELDQEQFKRFCDSIDSVHASLERENASLKAELDDALDGGIPMTDENMLAEGWIRLPKDADGEYVHVGDVMAYADGNTCPLPVVALVPPAVFLTEEGPRYADMCRHYVPTVEDVTCEFLQDLSDWLGLALDIDYIKADGLFAEFAAKLRLAGDAS